VHDEFRARTLVVAGAHVVLIALAEFPAVELRQRRVACTLPDRRLSWRTQRSGSIAEKHAFSGSLLGKSIK
jgi:hypothetical protein